MNGIGKDTLLVLNVGGIRYETLRSTLESKPQTKLANLDNLGEFYNHAKGEYFFDRDPTVFRCVLAYYRTGELHIPQDVCVPVMTKELLFWDISAAEIQQCCMARYASHKEQVDSLDAFDTMFYSHEWTDEMKKNKQRQYKLWSIVNDPFFSKAAMAYAVFSMMVVFLSIFIFVAETHQDFQTSLEDEDWADYYGVSFAHYRSVKALQRFSSKQKSSLNFEKSNGSASSVRKKRGVQNEGSDGPPTKVGVAPTDLSQTTTPPKQTNDDGGNWENEDQEIGENVEQESGSEDHEEIFPEQADTSKVFEWLSIAERICSVYFTVELFLRMILAPNKARFFKCFYTWSDILAVLPFYIMLVAIEANPSEKYSESALDALEFLNVLRVFRVLRLMKHYMGMQILLHTIKASLKEFLLMVIFLAVGILIFASLVYYAEISNPDSNITDIPVGFWWAIITMTTVGYGDTYPSSGGGYVIGSFCALSGVLMISFTVPIIVNNFMMFYTHAQAVSMKDAMKKEVMADKKRQLSVGSINKCHPLTVDDFDLDCAKSTVINPSEAWKE